MRRVLPALFALPLLAGTAAATHKAPLKEQYDVTAPVPYAVEAASHCTDGFEGLSKNTREVVLPDRGVLEVELSGFLGDWVLELLDSRGKLLGQAAQLDPANTAPVRKVTYKKATPGQEVRIAVCNVTGGPTASVAYTFTFR